MDRDDFTGIPDKTGEPLTAEQQAAVDQLLAGYDPAEWDLQGDDE